MFAKKLVAIVGPLGGPKATAPQKAQYTILVRDVRQAASKNSDSVLLEMLKLNIWPLLAGILAAGIISRRDGIGLPPDPGAFHDVHQGHL